VSTPMVSNSDTKLNNIFVVTMDGIFRGREDVLKLANGRPLWRGFTLVLTALIGKLSWVFELDG